MPIRPVEFEILLTLANEERHGYGIMQEAARMNGGELQIEAGTLYRALHRMLKDGWIAESDRRVPPREVGHADRKPGATWGGGWQVLGSPEIQRFEAQSRVNPARRGYSLQ